MGRLSSTWRGFIDHSSTWGDYHLHGGDSLTTPLHWGDYNLHGGDSLTTAPHGGDYNLHGGDSLTSPLHEETIIYMEGIH